VENVTRDGGAVDALVLNAGVEFSGDPVVRRTADGLEETIGVNHLGHFLLTNLLLPKLEASTEAHPRIVVTASEVHDPASPGGSVGKGATLGSLEGLERDGPAFEMVSGEEFDADKAYKDSKLCNMLFTYELERRLEAAGSKVTVNAFGPGLITRTGLFRNQNPLFVKAFDFATNSIFKVAETVDGGGNCLVFMLTDPSLEGVGGAYYNNTLSPGTPPTGHAFVRTPSSVESNSLDEAKKLWALSSSLVHLDVV
jgi:protochlorophyllide reductase